MKLHGNNLHHMMTFSICFQLDSSISKQSLSAKRTRNFSIHFCDRLLYQLHRFDCNPKIFFYRSFVCRFLQLFQRKKKFKSGSHRFAWPSATLHHLCRSKHGEF